MKMGVVARGLLVLVFSLFSSLASADSLAGRVVFQAEGLTLADAGATVVYLVPVGDGRVPAQPQPKARIQQGGARFVPDFLAVSIGQVIEMPNNDIIYHNVFSYSEPNDFDLGLYGSGESPKLRFEYAGLIRIYCSIHEDMDGLIFVAPSHLFDVPDATGQYSIEGVPAGRYDVHVWSERLPELVEPVEISPGVPVERVLGLGQPSR